MGLARMKDSYYTREFYHTYSKKSVVNYCLHTIDYA